MKKIFLLFGLLTISTPAFSQNLAPGLNYWYLNTSDNTELFVVEDSNGAKEKSVIVLHGGWGAEYSYLVSALRPLFDKYHFIFYDQRGSLRSPAPDCTISLQRFVKDLNELRKELDLQKVTLLSHSMGAKLAWAYLKTYPSHVKGLVLVAPILPNGERKSSVKKLKEFANNQKIQELKEVGLWDEIKQRVEYKKAGISPKKIVQMIPLTDKEKTKKFRIAFASINTYHLDRWRQMSSGEAFYDSSVAPAMQKNTPDSLLNGFKKVLRKYHKPSFVIIGDHDFVDFGLKVWADITDNFQDMELLKLKNAGHAVWIDRPGKFRDYVDYALTQINKK